MSRCPYLGYYTETIARNPHWRFVEVYADEGITGTLAKKREQFMKMIRDCEKGKIDYILTKSVARFARNTVDSLKYVRKLKARGIGVFFEEQNLDSLKTDSEMFIGIHSVLAQAESENISANVRWGIQQRMKSGTFKFRYNILGYRKGTDGQPEIVDSEAVTIRAIFRMYLDGSSLDQIKSYLENGNVLTKQGKTEWSKAIIHSILTNERYCGDMLMQKTFTENCITKKVKRNRGEMAKFLIPNNHPAIVDKDTFKLVQTEISRRNSKRKTSADTITEQGKYSGKFALSELLFCGECGSPYRRRTWKMKDGSTKKVWRCLSRVDHGTEYCNASVSVDEESLKAAICRGLSKAFECRDEILEVLTATVAYGVTGQDEAYDIYGLEQQLKKLDTDLELSISMQNRTEGDKSKYEKEIARIAADMITLRSRLDLAKAQVSAEDKINAEVARIKEMLSARSTDFTTFDDATVRRLVECIRVMSDKSIVITIKGGFQITEAV